MSVPSRQDPTHHPRPPLRIDFEPRFCENHVADLTAGCSFACIYCPFSQIGARARGVAQPTAVDLSNLGHLPAPASVFLSPASDPFAPQAVAGTHALLEHLLPRGTTVGIVTKGVIPDRTLTLLAQYREQIEGIAIGVTSLDEARNRVLEPGCPSARERLESIRGVAGRGLVAALRLDPLFPILDDRKSALEALVDEGTRRGACAVTATYVFAWGPYLRRLRSETLLAEACGHLTEKAPMEGGTAFSVPLERKLETYTFLAALAAERGLRFNTCGCKDLRVRESGLFSTRCRNTSFLEARSLATRTGGSRAPVRAALPERPGAPQA